ncbi:MAG: LysR family transcriptional regulator, partial [Shimia sp.]|nr:LysR family transcriptional regulator [Shimia sp.]
MDWSAMPYFLAVAREGSLRAAALSLGATHATVDRQVKALEASYGVRLFDRTRGGMTLTPAGDSLLPMAESAEDAMHGAKARVLGLD